MVGSKPLTLVVGLGATGLSCARFLARRGTPLAVADSRVEPPGLIRLREELPDVAVFVGGFDAKVFERAEQLVVSPGVSLSEPLIAAAMARGVPVLGDIELFARQVRAPVVAITGSNGKSTVTTLVGEMARRAGRHVVVGGNLGTPVLDLLDSHNDSAPLYEESDKGQEGGQECGVARLVDLYVLELSSFQLDTTHTLDAQAAVVLNISPDHLDRHGDMAHYVAAKSRVYRGKGRMVINADDPLVVAMADPERQRCCFTLGEPAGLGDYGVRSGSGEDWVARGERLLMPTAEMRMIGRHNLANALAALALAEAVGLPVDPCLETLREFTGLSHRCQFVAEVDGVAWYNDSKGTNVGATEAACAGLTGPLILIAGGQGKGQDFTPLRAALAGKARAVILIGVDAPQIRAVLEGVVPLVDALDLHTAVGRARELAQPGDRVLLSPACASFDMFRDYVDRGESFMREVHRLMASVTTSASGVKTKKAKNNGYHN
ncbi:UDP-N-acetylmuramoyl-L-alanine--D-glutamate ligase [Gammaproteobacteria bacterium]